MNPARCPFCGEPAHDGPAGPWHSLSVPPGWRYHDSPGEVPLPDGEPDLAQLEAEKATAIREAEKAFEEWKISFIETSNAAWAADAELGEEGASHPVLGLDSLLGLLDSFAKAGIRWRATVHAERNAKRESLLAGRRLFRMLGLG